MNFTVAAEAIESMELQLMQALKWNLNPPTAIMFVRQLLCCLPNAPYLSQWKQTTAIAIAESHLDAGLKSEATMTMAASTQAVAALFCAVEDLPAVRRASVYKFLLQAVHMTGPAQQREVLSVQAVLRRLVKAESQPEVVEEVTCQTKRPATTEVDCTMEPAAKKQRVAVVVKDSYAVSPRSIVA